MITKDKVTIEIAEGEGFYDTLRGRSVFMATVTRNQLEDALAELNKPVLPKPGQEVRGISSKTWYRIVDHTRTEFVPPYPTTKSIWSVNYIGMLIPLNHEDYDAIRDIPE